MALNRKWLASLGLALWLTVSVAGGLLAQDATPEATESPALIEIEATAEATVEATEMPITDLSYNTPVTGRIDAGESEEWPLSVLSADRIRIVAERISGNLIPSVVLLDADENELTSSYGANPDGATAEIRYVDLPAAGDYLIRVESYDGDTAGRYRLTVEPLGTAEDNVNNMLEIGPIAPGETIEGTITPTHWFQRYVYDAPASDTIAVIGERTNGTLRPQVQILDANNSALTTGYTEATGDQAFITRYELPGPGRYIIAIFRENGMSGVTEGDYRLTLQMIGSGEGNPLLAGVAGDVEYDTPLTGEITPERWYEDWDLTAEATDTITIKVERPASAEAGNLRPMVYLLGGSGQEINRGYPENRGDIALIEGATLGNPGSYIVRVTRENGQTGLTAGQYTLTVILNGAGEGSSILRGVTGDIAVGDTVEGEVTDARWLDSWRFNATSGQRLHIEVRRTDGTLIPMIEIRDRNGQKITSAYPESTRDLAVLDYTMPANGEYLIAATRERGQQGVTTGSYELTVRVSE